MVSASTSLYRLFRAKETCLVYTFTFYMCMKTQRSFHSTYIEYCSSSVLWLWTLESTNNNQTMLINVNDGNVASGFYMRHKSCLLASWLKIIRLIHFTCVAFIVCHVVVAAHILALNWKLLRMCGYECGKRMYYAWIKPYVWMCVEALIEP